MVIQLGQAKQGGLQKMLLECYLIFLLNIGSFVPSTQLKCNIFRKKIKLHTEFMDLVRTRVKKQSYKWKVKVDLFNTNRTKLFDIFSENSDARKNREMETGVPMGPGEWAFLNDQWSERKMYCDDFLEKVWVAQVAQRQRKN